MMVKAWSVDAARTTSFPAAVSPCTAGKDWADEKKEPDRRTDERRTMRGFIAVEAIGKLRA